MLKKTITYKDFNGDPVTEDLFFHLSQAELVEIEVSFQPDGLAVAMQKMMDSNDGKAIVTTFKDIILQAYGKKSSDGKRFIKNSLIREEFESSKAWETIFMELVTDPDAMNEFVMGIIPAELVAQAEKLAGPAEPKPEPRRMTVQRAKEAGYSGELLTEKIIAGEIVIVDD
jgi:hypothetical protein